MPRQPNQIRRTIRWAAWGAVTAALLILLAVIVRGYVFPGPMTATGGDVGGPFVMTTADGRRVTEADFIGKPAAYFFGYTYCPDVCPTTLYEAGQWLSSLGADAEKLNFVFVSVDPDRDTPQHLAEYLSAFDPRIIGLTGTPAETSAMIRAFRVYASKVPQDDGSYTMDHTASILLMDRNGRFVGTIRNGEDTEKVIATLRGLIAG